MIAYLCVAAGSALGGMARYGFGLLAVRLWGQSFPWGTIAINVIGSFAIAFFGTLTLSDGLMPASPNARIFVMVGICGGFTTFSSFSLQTLDLARGGAWIGAAGNIALSVFACLIAVAAGHVSAARLSPRHAEAFGTSYILAVLDRPATAHRVLAAAGLAARRLGNPRLDVLHMSGDPVDVSMPTEEVATDRQAETARRSAELHEIFQAWHHDTTLGTWRDIAGPAAAVLAAEARHADLVILGYPLASAAAGRMLQAALNDSPATTLLVSARAQATPCSHIAVTCTDTKRTARALAAGMQLLLEADRVCVLSAPGDEVPEALMEWLGAAGVSVALERVDLRDRGASAAMLEAAGRVGADLLVVGANAQQAVLS